MRPILATILLLATAAATAAAADPPRKPETREPRAAGADRVTDAQREARRRAAEALARFAWTDLGRPEHRWVGEPISLSLRDADLTEVLRSFAKMVDVNLVIDPGVQGKVTVELRDVPWDQALYVILKSNGLGMEISGNVWSMQPAERLLKDD